VGEETFRISRELVDEFMVVDTDAVCAAIKDVFVDTRSIVEPSGALAVAAIKQYVASATRPSARDLRSHPVRRQHELRPPALRRRARRGGRGARGAVRRDDPRGARQLPPLLRGDRRAARRAAQRDRIQLPHQRRRKAHVFVGLTTHGKGESGPRSPPTSRATASRRWTSPTTNWPRSTCATWWAAIRAGADERLLRFVFPERPGALMKFLSTCGRAGTSRCSTTATRAPTTAASWSACRCRPGDNKAFQAFLDTLGYPHVEETGPTRSTACSCIEEATGRGTGLDDAQLAHKRLVLADALARHAGTTQPLDALAAFGGFEIAMMAGAMLQAASERRVVLVDGFIAGAAALVARSLAPAAQDYMVFCHRGDEHGHRLLLDHLKAQPLLDLGLRLGEGTGALLAWPLLQSAANFLHEMASFESAGVSGKESA
jgi:hypothetical protein